MIFEEALDESLKEKGENVFGNWREINPRYRVAESSATLSSAITWKVGNVPNELGDLAQETSSQSLEGASCFLAAYNKIGEERHLLLNKKEPGIAGFENSWPLQMENDTEIKKWSTGKD